MIAKLNTLAALNAIQWTFVVLLALLYIISCYRTARSMAGGGRSFWRWFLITIVVTAIPAMIITSRDRMKALKPQSRANLKQCPHCGQLIDPNDADNTLYEGFCPGCRLRYEEDKFA